MHRGLHVYLPRATVGAALRHDINRLNGLILSPGGLAPMLGSQMRTLAETAASLNPTAREVALQATIDLALAALRLDIGQQSIESETSRMACSRRPAATSTATWARPISRPSGSPRGSIARAPICTGCSRAMT